MQRRETVDEYVARGGRIRNIPSKTPNQNAVRWRSISALFDVDDYEYQQDLANSIYADEATRKELPEALLN